MKVAEILSGPETWTQAKPGMPSFDGRFCLATAAERATGRSFVYLAAEMLDAIGLSVPVPRDKQLNAVFEWNDAPERTFAEVHAVAAEFDRRWSLRASPPERSGGRPLGPTMKPSDGTPEAR